MKRYKERFIFYINKDMKKAMEARAYELDTSMADYIRTLINLDIKLCNIAYLNSVKDDYNDNVDNLTKKLSGYYKGLR